MPLIGRHWPHFFKWDYISNFFTNKCITKQLVNKIKPDIIHLQGAENAYYSSTILPLLKKYPSILTIQGFISHASSLQSKQLKKRVVTEQKIIQSIPVAFYRTKKMAEDIKRINPSVMLFWNMYASLSIENELKQVNKKYDIVFFARVSKDKGIFDLLQAVAMLQVTHPDISLCVIGKEVESVKQYAEDLGVEKQVYWAGFLSTQKEVHQLAAQAKVSVLPTYFDIIPGTIVESMFLGIPVVAYHTDSIPEINEKEEVVSLVEKGNVSALAKAIEELLNNPNLRKERSKKGIKRANEMFVYKDEDVRLSLLEGYRQAIEIFQEKKKNKKEKKA
jgi:glycosyltransferase involved in cell wall biosynthesis